MPLGCAGAHWLLDGLLRPWEQQRKMNTMKMTGCLEPLLNPRILGTFRGTKRFLLSFRTARKGLNQQPFCWVLPMVASLGWLSFSLVGESHTAHSWMALYSLQSLFMLSQLILTTVLGGIRQRGKASCQVQINRGEARINPTSFAYRFRPLHTISCSTHS